MFEARVTGWITVFFPALGKFDLRKACFEKRMKTIGIAPALENAVHVQGRRGLDPDKSGVIIRGCSMKRFPRGLSSAAVHRTWPDVGKEQDLPF
jgi:hypothetical protein